MSWVISNGIAGAGSHMAVVLQQHRDKYQLYLGEYRKTKVLPACRCICLRVLLDDLVIDSIDAGHDQCHERAR